MSREIAIIDVGTNSILALGIRETGEVLFNDYQISELGKGMHQNDNYLALDKIDKAFEIISNFVNKLRTLNISTIKIIGTSASRDAKNIHILIDKIKSLDLDYHIISGDEEAYYTYLGALNLYKDPEQMNFVMMDIGGGSTEIIYGKGSEITYKKSFQLGVLRLQNMNSKIQLTQNDEAEINAQINQFYSDLPKVDSTQTFVGIGGTFTTIAAINLKLKNYKADLVNGHRISCDECIKLYNEINNLSLEERKSIVGLEFKRAPLIHFGLRIVIEFMQKQGIEKLYFTDFGLRFGLAKNYFKST